MGEINYKQVDAVVVGVGFAGLHMVYSLREKGYSVKGFEAGDDVGGVWNTNRYPGARCDTPGIYYSYTLSKELYNEWSWSTDSSFPTQGEILKYHQFMADRLDVRKDISFNTKVTRAQFNIASNHWEVETSTGENYTAKFLMTCIGCLTVSHKPNLDGQENFKGEIYHTSEWPKTPVDFKGKKVAVFGTGSSGVQAIPVIAEEAAELTVFQRTPQYVAPAKHDLYSLETYQKVKEEFDTIRPEQRLSPAGVPGFQAATRSIFELSDAEREEILEQYWDVSGASLLYAFADIRHDDNANKYIQDFYRKKLKEVVKDPVIAEKLTPTYLFGAKRVIGGFNYYETFNRDNVNLVSLKEEPVVCVTENGIKTTDGFYEIDIIVYATGFDALTGPLSKFNIIGTKGRTMREKWEDGHNLKSFLGLAYEEFPNMFSIGGPHFAFLVNAAPNIEYLVEYILEILDYMEKTDANYVEATGKGEEDWTKYVNDLAKGTIYTRVDSWYNGGNIEGKARGLLGFTGSFQEYLGFFEKTKKENYSMYDFKKINSLQKI